MIITAENAMCLSFSSVNVCEYDIIFIDLVLMKDEFYFDYYQLVLKSNKVIIRTYLISKPMLQEFWLNRIY